MKNLPPRVKVSRLCAHFYQQGWVSGTGGGLSLRDGDKIYIAPSGVQKEQIAPNDIFVLDPEGNILDSETNGASNGHNLKLSACAPLFFKAYNLRDAGAVIHSHSMYAALVTNLSVRNTCGCEGYTSNVFRISGYEMQKGIPGHGVKEPLEVPIIENTEHEADLAGALEKAIKAYPKTHAVLVRRHGVYIWGKDWAQAKTIAECYHYLFEIAVRQHSLGRHL
jgi:methylthioribulose-1-phosphate dehydratase